MPAAAVLLLLLLVLVLLDIDQAAGSLQHHHHHHHHHARDRHLLVQGEIRCRECFNNASELPVPIPGVQVMVTCGTHLRRVETNASGEFQLYVVAGKPFQCSLTLDKDSLPGNCSRPVYRANTEFVFKAGDTRIENFLFKPVDCDSRHRYKFHHHGHHHHKSHHHHRHGHHHHHDQSPPPPPAYPAHTSPPLAVPPLQPPASSPST